MEPSTGIGQGQRDVILYFITQELLRLLSLRATLRWLRWLAAFKFATNRAERRRSEAWGSSVLPASSPPSEREAFARRHLTNRVIYSHLPGLLLVHDSLENQDLLRVEGWHHVEVALGRGRGCVLLITHLGLPRLMRWHLRARAHPVLNLMTKSLSEYPEGSWRSRLRSWHRRRYRMDDQTTLGHGGLGLKYLKPAYHHLGRNGIVCISGDSPDPVTGRSISVRGQVLKVATGGLSLGLMTGATVIPCFTVLRQEPPFELQFGPPLQPGESPLQEDRLTSMLQDYAARMGRHIDLHPDNVLHPIHLPEGTGQANPIGRPQPSLQA